MKKDIENSDRCGSSYEKEIAHLKAEIKELRRTLSKCMYALQEEEELQKDQERLDWLQSSDLTLHSWEEGDVWGSKGVWTIREFIDEKIKEDL